MKTYSSRAASTYVGLVGAMCWLSLAFVACDCGDGNLDPDAKVEDVNGDVVVDPKPPCERESAPDACGEPCEDDDGCAGPTHCGSDGTCTAECGPPGTACAEAGHFCSSQGICLMLPDASIPDGGECIDLELTPERVVPNVILLIDQSGSMDVNDVAMGGGTNLRRWNAVRELLVGRCGPSNRNPSNGICSTSPEPGDHGVVGRTHELVNYAMVFYSSSNGDFPPPSHSGDTCPLLTSAPFAVGGYEAMRDVFRATPWHGFDGASNNGDTPTGESIRAVMETIFDPEDPNPTILVLATDGEPDSCACPNFGSCPTCCANSQQNQVRQEVLDEAASAYAQGVQTIVLAISNSIAGNPHFQELANVGSGRPANGSGPGGDAPLYEATSGAQIEAAFDAIIGAALSCDIELNATVSAQHLCAGTVILKGVELECDGPDGYSRVDDRRIRLEGEACDTWLEDPAAQLEATWPCGTIIIGPPG